MMPLAPIMNNVNIKIDTLLGDIMISRSLFHRENPCNAVLTLVTNSMYETRGSTMFHINTLKNKVTRLKKTKEKKQKTV